jgi:hypothetical protein
MNPMPALPPPLPVLERGGAMKREGLELCFGGLKYEKQPYEGWFISDIMKLSLFGVAEFVKAFCLLTLD